MTIFWKHAIVNRRVLKHFQVWWSRCPPRKCEGVIQNIAWLIQENENSSMSWPHSIRVCETGHGIDQFRNSNVHQKIFTTRPMQRIRHPWICLSNHYYHNQYTCIFCFNCLNPSFNSTTFPLLSRHYKGTSQKNSFKVAKFAF